LPAASCRVILGLHEAVDQPLDNHHVALSEFLAGELAAGVGDDLGGEGYVTNKAWVVDFHICNIPLVEQQFLACRCSLCF